MRCTWVGAFIHRDGGGPETGAILHSRRGYAAGELKHGPLALVDENMPVVALAPNDELPESSTPTASALARQAAFCLCKGESVCSPSKA